MNTNKKVIKLITFFLIFSLAWNFSGYSVPDASVAKFAESPSEVVVLSLNDCVRHALGNSFDVKLAKLDLYIEETDVMYKKAVFDTFLYGGASYSEDKRQELSVFASDDDQINEYGLGVKTTLPTGTELSAKWEDTRNWANTDFVSKNPSHNAELTLTAKQPIGKNFFGYADRTNISIAELAVKNADLDMQDRIEELVADVEKAYYELVFNKRALDIFRGILEKAKNLYEADKKKFDMGMLEKVDILGSEANVSKRTAEEIVADNAYNRAQEDLKLIMNYDEARRIVPEETFSTDNQFNQNLENCLKEAFEKRRDYQIAIRDVNKKGLNLKVKDNMKWPEIDLTLSMAMNGLERNFGKAAKKTTVNDNNYYYAGVEFTVPFENREAQSDYLEAKYEKEKSLVDLKKVERGIITDVGNAFGDTNSFHKSLKFTQKAVELQTSKLAEEEKRFHYGRSNTKRLIDYQQDLLRAELENADFHLKYKKAKIDLDRSMNIILGEFEDLL